jgi:hypothetical protein
MTKIDDDLALEAARQALGLPHMEDKERLRATLIGTIDAMNILDRAAFRLTVARLYRQSTSDEASSPRFLVVASVFTALIPVSLTVLTLWLIAATHLDLLLKIALVIACVFFAFLSFASSRVLFRNVSQARRTI